MGTNLVCCKRSENISNILKQKDELSNKNEEEDYLKFDEKNNNKLDNEIELIIETELPKDFPHNLSINNSNSPFFLKNIYDDNQQEILIDENSLMEEQIIYSIYNLPKEELTKINEFYKLCNKNGKPRALDDFDKKGWTKFYPINDQFFLFSENDKNIEKNKIKIYNQNEINKMKIYQGDINLVGERHGFLYKLWKMLKSMPINRFFESSQIVRRYFCW